MIEQHHQPLEDAYLQAKSEGKWLLVHLPHELALPFTFLNTTLWNSDLVREIVLSAFPSSAQFKFLELDSTEATLVYKKTYQVTQFPHLAVVDPTTCNMVWRMDGPTAVDSIATEYVTESFLQAVLELKPLEPDDTTKMTSSPDTTFVGWDLFAPPKRLIHVGRNANGNDIDAAATMNVHQLLDMAKHSKRWLVVHLADNQDFGSLALNRDVWKNEVVQGLILEGCIFWQIKYSTFAGMLYSQRYKVDKYPHVGILDFNTENLIWHKEGWNQAQMKHAAQVFLEALLSLPNRKTSTTTSPPSTIMPSIEFLQNTSIGGDNQSMINTSSADGSEGGGSWSFIESLDKVRRRVAAVDLQDGDGDNGDWSLLGSLELASVTSGGGVGGGGGGGGDRSISSSHNGGPLSSLAGWEMIEPPRNIATYFQKSYHEAKEAAAVEGKLLLVNIQDYENDFASQALNLDVWLDGRVQELLLNRFVFWQKVHSDPACSSYLRKHGSHDAASFPHIGIVSPLRDTVLWRVEGWVWTRDEPWTAKQFIRNLQEYADYQDFTLPSQIVADANQQTQDDLLEETPSDQSRLQTNSNDSMGEQGEVANAENPTLDMEEPCLRNIIASILRESLKRVLGTTSLALPNTIVTRSRNDTTWDYECSVAKANLPAILANLRMSPSEIAKKVVVSVGVDHPALDSVKCFGPMIVFRVCDQFLEQRLKRFVDKAPLPRVDPERILVDFSLPDVKEIKLGHLRSAIIGDTVCRLFESVGHVVIRQGYFHGLRSNVGKPLSFHSAVEPGLSFRSDEDNETTTTSSAPTKVRHNMTDMPNKKCKLWSHAVLTPQPSQWSHVCDLLNVRAIKPLLIDEFIPGIIDECKKKGMLQIYRTGSSCKIGTAEIVLEKNGFYSVQSAQLASLKFQLQNWDPDRTFIVGQHKFALAYANIFEAARALRWCDSGQQLRFVGVGWITDSGDYEAVSSMSVDDVFEKAKLLVSFDSESPFGSGEGPTICDAIRYNDLRRSCLAMYAFSYSDLSKTRPKLMLRKLENMIQQHSRSSAGDDNVTQQSLIQHDNARRFALHVQRFPEIVEDTLQDFHMGRIVEFLDDMESYAMALEACPIGKTENRLPLLTAAVTTTKKGLEILGIGLTKDTNETFIQGW